MKMLALACGHTMPAINSGEYMTTARVSADAGRIGGVSWQINGPIGIVNASGYVMANDYGLNPAALADALEYMRVSKTVKATALVIDTPGGYLSYVRQGAEAVRMHASEKPVHVLTQTVLASAGYWIAAGATRILAMQGASVGSIGVAAEIQDLQKHNEQNGIRVINLATGALKSVGAYMSELTPEQEEYARQSVQENFDDFRAAVAVRALNPLVFAGGVYQKQAKELGLIDGNIDSVAAHIALMQRTFI